MSSSGALERSGADNRICYKCLLSEADPKAYRETIEAYINRAPDKRRVSDEEYDRRLDICKECELLNAGTCFACGCYVELKAVYKDGHCPKKKW
ncbi:MAG TPA: hypothetical protein DD722_00315 [Lachnospiraceae bacterium]|nr:hypothetical protein [Lachnospiraceae bacterium]